VHFGQPLHVCARLICSASITYGSWDEAAQPFCWRAENSLNDWRPCGVVIEVDVNAHVKTSGQRAASQLLLPQHHCWWGLRQALCPTRSGMRRQGTMLRCSTYSSKKTSRRHMLWTSRLRVLLQRRRMTTQSGWWCPTWHRRPLRWSPTRHTHNRICQHCVHVDGAFLSEFFGQSPVALGHRPRGDAPSAHGSTGDTCCTPLHGI